MALEGGSSPDVPSSSMGPRRGQTELFFSWDGTTGSTENATRLRKFLLAKGYFIHEHSGSVFGNGTVTSSVPDAVIDTMRRCTVFLVCVSRPYTTNINCKKLCLTARKMLETERKTAPEMLFAMIDGTYTTDSQPYKVSGWLGFLLRDALWSPAWSHAHAAGAAEAVMGTVKLRRNVVVVTKEELRRIDRGEEATGPLSKSPSSKSPSRSGTKSSSSSGGGGSGGTNRESFPVGNDASGGEADIPDESDEKPSASTPAEVEAKTPLPLPLRGILKKDSKSRDADGDDRAASKSDSKRAERDWVSVEAEEYAEEFD